MVEPCSLGGGGTMTLPGSFLRGAQIFFAIDAKASIAIRARVERMKHPRPMDKSSTRRRRNSPIRRRSVTTEEGHCAWHWGTKQNDVACLSSGAISRDALEKSSENCPKTLGHFWKVFRMDICSRAYIMRFPLQKPELRLPSGAKERQIKIMQ